MCPEDGGWKFLQNVGNNFSVHLGRRECVTTFQYILLCGNVVRFSVYTGRLERERR
jgi:hypothetical protein